MTNSVPPPKKEAISLPMITDKEISRLQKLKGEVIQNSLLYSIFGVGICEGLRVIFRKISFILYPVTIEPAPIKINRATIQSLRFGRPFLVFFGMTLSFSYFSMRFTEERYQQCLKYQDLLNEYLNYKERKLKLLYMENSDQSANKND